MYLLHYWVILFVNEAVYLRTHCVPESHLSSFSVSLFRSPCVKEHVSNKSAYLCGVMKTYRQKTRAGPAAAAAATNGPIQVKKQKYSYEFTLGEKNCELKFKLYGRVFLSMLQ